MRNFSIYRQHNKINEQVTKNNEKFFELTKFEKNFGKLDNS